jgi:hypothetical protein
MGNRSEGLVWEVIDSEKHYASLGPAQLTRDDLLQIAFLLQALDGGPPLLWASPAADRDAKVFVSSFDELAALPAGVRENISLVSAGLRISVLLWRDQTTLIGDDRQPAVLDVAERIAAVVQRRVRVRRILLNPVFAARFYLTEFSPTVVLLLTLLGASVMSNGMPLWRYLLGVLAVFLVQYFGKAFAMSRWRKPGDPAFGSTVALGGD